MRDLGRRDPPGPDSKGALKVGASGPFSPRPKGTESPRPKGPLRWGPSAP